MQTCRSGPVTAADILFDQNAILRTSNQASADSVAAQINAGTLTEQAYLTSLVTQSFNTSMPSTIVYNQMYGIAMSTSKEFDILAAFSANQLNFGTKIGVQDATVYVYEALGQALASGNDTGLTTFANTFGPAAIPNDTTFVQTAYQDVFGQLGGAAQIQHFVNQVNFFKTIYTQNPPAGATTPDAIDLLARGAVYGQMLGVAVQNGFGNYVANSAAFLQDLATVNSFTGAALGTFNTPLETQPQNSNPFVNGVTIALKVGADNVSPTNTDPLFRSTSGNDLILAPNNGELGDADTLDGGLGFDSVRGRFDDNGAPTLRNIEQFKLQANAGNNDFSFVNATGVQQAWVVGDNTGSEDTKFTGLKLGTTVGIENFNNAAGDADNNSEFVFAGANGTQTVDLAVNNAGKYTASLINTGGQETDLVINKIATLDVCVLGNSNFGDFDADALTTINLRGLNNIRFDFDEGGNVLPVLTKVDASNLAGFTVFNFGDDDQYGGALTVLVGKGGSQTLINADLADSITNNVGADVARFDFVGNVKNASVVTGVLDAQTVKISGFASGTDTIDFRNYNGPANDDGVYVLSAGQNAITDSQANLKAAADVALDIANNSTATSEIAAFLYQGSIYVAIDNNNNEALSVGDGLIKLVGITKVVQADFSV